MQAINGFFDEYRWLSNFHRIPIFWEGLTYPSTENAYQASKFTHPTFHLMFMDCSSGKAKRISRKYKEHIRSDWNDVRLNLMLKLNRIKFTNPELRQKLLDTGDDYLEETNTWNDTFWGVCDGKGQNQLGKILMQIRKEIKAGIEF